MFKKIMLMVAFGLVSCTQNIELATYQINGQTQTLKSKVAMGNFEKLFDQISPQDMEYVVADLDVLKIATKGQTFEQELFVLEAQKLSNYQDDLTYIDTMEYKKVSLPLELSAEDGMKKISNEVAKQVVEVTEVSRIMFTNDVDEQTLEMIFEELLVAEDVAPAFGMKAEEVSQEMLGAQRGGYLAHVVKGQFPVIDELVFEQKFEGLYEEVLTDERGSYIVYVHSPVRKVKVADFEKENIQISPNYILVQYVNDNIEYLYTANDSNSITINEEQVSVLDVSEDEKIIKIWGKTYTVKQVIDQLLILMGGKPDTELSIENMFTFISPTPPNKVSSALQQMAVIDKGYNKNREKTKEYQKALEESLKDYELSVVFSIVSAEISKNVSTNVSRAEMEEFYSDVNNRPIKSYSDFGMPTFATLEESKEQIEQSIIGQRFEQARLLYGYQMDEEYSIVWNEENLLKYAMELQKKYDKFAEKNGLNEEFVY